MVTFVISQHSSNMKYYVNKNDQMGECRVGKLLLYTKNDEDLVPFTSPFKKMNVSQIKKDNQSKLEFVPNSISADAATCHHFFVYFKVRCG